MKRAFCWYVYHCGRVSSYWERCANVNAKLLELQWSTKGLKSCFLLNIVSVYNFSVFLAIDVSSKWKWHLDDNIICMYMLVGIWFVIYQSLVDHPLRRLVRLQTFFVCVCRLRRVVPTRRRARRRRFRPWQSQMSALRPVMQKHSQAVLSHKQPPSSHKKSWFSPSLPLHFKHHKFFQTETNIDHRLSFVFFFSSFFSLFYHSRCIQQ